MLQKAERPRFMRVSYIFCLMLSQTDAANARGHYLVPVQGTKNRVVRFSLELEAKSI